MKEKIGWYKESADHFLCANCFSKIEGLIKEEYRPIYEEDLVDDIYSCDACKKEIDYKKDRQNNKLENKNMENQQNEGLKKQQEIEKGVLEQYSQMFTVMGLPGAKETAKRLLDRAIEKSKKEETYDLPSNFGNIILREEKTDDPVVEKFAEEIRKTLSPKRVEGVRDEDIRWWWNLNDVERSIMVGVDEFHCTALFLKECDEGKTTDEANEIVWKFHPKYTYGYRGETKDMPQQIKDIFPLPIELKDRINIYIAKKTKTNSEKYKKDIKSSPTFNALVRKEIKAGNI